MLSSYHQPIILASCVPPPEEFFEVNVDGSLNVRNKRAGIGIVLRGRAMVICLRHV